MRQSSEMPHHRARLIEPVLRKGLKAFPIIGLLGHRQTGKTTLLNLLAKEYATLDRGSVREVAQTDPLGFLSKHAAPFAIDECQLCPDLFPVMKEWVRRKPIPGQFLLSGSVRFSARKQIRESLTGRILLLELFPFSLAETYARKVKDPLALGISKGVPFFTPKQWHHYLLAGGLPGLCFKHDTGLRSAAFESHLDTVLNRDLQLIYETRLDFTALRQFIRSLARQAGMALDYAELARQARISRESTKKLVRAFEALFLIRLIPDRAKPSRSVLLWEDVGLLHHVSEGQLPSAIFTLNAFYQNIRCSLKYPFGAIGTFYSYRTRGGANVPLVFSRGAENYGWIFVETHDADRASIASAHSFLKAYKNSWVHIVGINLENRQLSSGIVTRNLLGLL